MSNSSMSVPAAVSGSTHRFSWRWYLADLQKHPEGLKVFSCFACGGGSTMGYKLAGYNVLGCCEIDKAMIEIYRVNHHPKFSYCIDVRELLSLNLPEELYDLDVLDGSPPCSVFSIAGKREAGWGVEKQFREGQKKQRLDDLFFAFIDVARGLKPKVVVAENVAGLIKGNARGYVNEIIRAFDAAGYEVQLFLLNSARMGVPQMRERCFFVGRRKDLKLPPIVFNFNEEPITFGEVRSEHGLPSNGMLGELMKYRRPTDGCVADINRRIRRKNVGFSEPIMSDEKPAHTITAGGSMYRMSDGCRLSKEDIVNCQTFPQDYDFGTQSPQYVCGMSVPPVMMGNIAAEIKKQLFGK